MTAKAEGVPSFTVFTLARSGKLAGYESQEGYQATIRVMEALGLNDIEYDDKTAQPATEQFWGQFDGLF